MAEIKTRIVSSMEKIFPCEEPSALKQAMTALGDESYSFQIALFPELTENARFTHLDVTFYVTSPLDVTVRQVGLVPVTLPYFDNSDGGYLKDDPGLFPDPLMPIQKGTVRLMTGRWNSLFVEVKTGHHPEKSYPVAFRFEPLSPAYAPFKERLALQVIGKRLPKVDFNYTSWFHGDCLADYYHIPVFSEKHWTIMENHMRLAAEMGQTMVLTPLFTPPLDTAVGGERTTVQLVGVTKGPEGYRFDFSLLDRFVTTARRAGITAFEMSHLFTQWGGNSCPKIIAEVDGVTRKIFGWDDEALCEDYQAFLKAFLPALTAHFPLIGLNPGNVVFHLTDEPHKDHLPQYKKLKELVAPLVKGYTIMDAMSDYDYFADGITACPVVATSALAPFLTNKRPERFWVYYCCGQGTNGLSNRFIDMPGSRTRILGVQMYQEDVKGLLQWGLNFYSSQYSLKPIDPFKVTDADCSFPSGDAFIIYPGPDGEAIPSQRMILVHEAFQDMRALKLLESMTSRAHVMELIQKTAASFGFEGPLTFNDYPRGEDFLLTLRDEVNREICLAKHALIEV